MIVFGDRSEPWAVARGGVRRWLHCRFLTDELSETQRDEFEAWLCGRGVDVTVRGLITVTYDATGWRMHLADRLVDVRSLEELPVWLQAPEPATEPKPKRAPRVRS